MKGLLLKEYYALRPYFKKQLLVLLVLFVFFVAVSSTFSILVPMTLFFIANLMLSSFTMDEQSHWDSYALTLPVTRTRIIVSKYLTFFGTLLITCCVGTPIVCIMEKVIFHQTPVIPAISAAASLLLAGLLLCVLLPLAVKIGIERARIAIVICYLLPFVLVVLVSNQPDAFLHFLMPILELPWYLLALLSLALYLAIMAFSVLLSIKFYKAKEF